MPLDNFFKLDPKTETLLKKIKGPILIFGAGGFIGSNIFASLLTARKDVYGTSRNPLKNKRLKILNISKNKIIQCDVNNLKKLKTILSKLKPKTVFNLSAYGAYSTQEDPFKIYQTNFLSTVNIIEELKKYNFQSYIHAGSSSEYGENSEKPKEDEKTSPNSHYAVSKAAVASLLNYYGKTEKLPVIHFRLYAVYGPLEEKDRLIPTILNFAKKGKYPPFVSKKITRDFIFTSDITKAFIKASLNRNKKNYGEAFNVGTGKKTTIEDLALTVKSIYKLKDKPVFGTMKNRKWDHGKDWYANSTKAAKLLNFKAEINLKEGLKKTIEFNNIIKWQ
ncbi:MAG: hypothetical protein A2152_02020 [Candidatus Levybacteria bacterium RBG_16_35_6]|nr:MAG: hypothetical protein A2152_02020 [Candidatus Levybacteria bacterium RBG_16_35_6]